jgi:D-3-phosphoglycerate dehydrogenase
MTRNTYPRDRLPVLLLENIHPRAAERFPEEGYPVETLSGRPGRGGADRAVGRRGGGAGRALQDARDRPRSGRRAAPAERGRLLHRHRPDRRRGGGPRRAAGVQRPLLQHPLGGGVGDRGDHRAQPAAVRPLAGAARRALDQVGEGAAEVRGKKLGIVGYGAIGSQLSVLAEAVGMEVHYFDTAEKLALGNARKRRSLPELLGAVDVVSLHVDGRAENRNLIGPAEFAAMRDGALLLNLAAAMLWTTSAGGRDHRRASWPARRSTSSRRSPTATASRSARSCKACPT